VSVSSVLLSVVLAAVQLDPAPSSAPSAVVAPDAPLQTQPTPTPPPSTPTPSETISPPPPVDIGANINAAYANAESVQGPLDGRWRLVGADGTDLFAFVMADTGGAPSSRAATPDAPAIEGAWRDLRRPGALAASGFLQSVVHATDAVEIRFYEADPSAPTVVKLRADAAGAWSGDLVEAGSSRPVVMKRF